MNFKKKWQRFWTLNRHHDGGFTLVELIVVIAIMAILAGVGTAGYAGYIKAANKNADKVLVGNVIRAIETGTYGAAVEIGEALQVTQKGTKMPVGIVVLRQDEHGTTMQSASVHSSIQADTACVIEEITFKEKTEAGTDTWRWGRKEETVYSVTDSETISVCTTHSLLNETSVRVWKDGKTSDADDREEESHTRNFLFKDNCTLALPENGHVQGESISMDTYEPQAGDFVTTNGSGAIHDALVLAFGDDPYAEMKLKSGDWTASGNMPSVYSDITLSWGRAEVLADMMEGLVNMEVEIAGYPIDVGPIISGALGIGQYETSADIVYAVGNAVAGSFAGKEDFIAQWESYGDWPEKPEDSDDQGQFGGDAFGIDRDTYQGMEFYSAMRGSYNTCVAAYVQQHHTGTPEEVAAHVAALAGYGQSAGELVEEKTGLHGETLDAVLHSVAGENFPRQLCKESFATEDAAARAMLGAADCPECARLYSEYVDSGADKEDAAAMFDMYIGVSELDPATLEMMKDGELKNAGDETVDFFDYYGSFLQEYQGMYEAAMNLANGKSAVVIQVYYENGALTCTVSPTAANPRT